MRVASSSIGKLKDFAGSVRSAWLVATGFVSVLFMSAPINSQMDIDTAYADVPASGCAGSCACGACTNCSGCDSGDCDCCGGGDK